MPKSTNTFIFCVAGRQNASKNSSHGHTLGGSLPDMSDHEAMQRFFLQQVTTTFLTVVKKENTYLYFIS